MQEVAVEAGVSISTVSHTVNGTRTVSAEVRERVLTAMEELNYRPNSVARNLRRQSTQTLGMIIPDASNPYFADLVRGIEQAAFRRDYSVVLCNSGGESETESRYLDVLVQNRVDGILFVPTSDESCERQLRDAFQRRIHVVLVDRDEPDMEVPSVTSDNGDGARQAVQHLVDLGHRRIAFIGGPPTLTNSLERLKGFRRAMRDLRVDVGPELVVQGDFRFEGGRAAAGRLLDAEARPSAIFACNDLMAVGAVSAAAERGLSIPADLSIVGFDDIQLARYFNPPLTTVAQSTTRMGELAAALVIDMIVGEVVEAQRHVLPTTLVERGSSAAVT